MSLKIISKEGFNGFYKGIIAQLIAREMKKNKGLILAKDLEEYQAIWRAPIKFDYREYTVFAMPPPSSGGIVIAQILQTLEHFELDKLGQNSSGTIHLWAEASKQAYADRSKFLGDPDFYNVPAERLISESYSSYLYNQINPFYARPSVLINPNTEWILDDSGETTHFSIVDAAGMAVSCTYTLNSGFGCKAVVEGTGILLNNEMDDFSVKPGFPNQYGLIGSEANKILPEKRMLSSMTPTIVTKRDKLFMVLGSPGGSRIMNAVAQVISNVIDYDYNIREAIESARFHHQWLPDTLYLEKDRFNLDTINSLNNKGYNIGYMESIGNVNAILLRENMILQGWSDPRRNGIASGY